MTGWKSVPTAGRKDGAFVLLADKRVRNRCGMLSLKPFWWRGLKRPWTGWWRYHKRKTGDPTNPAAKKGVAIAASKPPRTGP